MEKLVIVFIFLVLTGVLIGRIKSAKTKRRRQLIDNYRFPLKITQQLSEKYPHLTQAQVNQVIEGLREYFHICNMAGKNFVSMPSQAVDQAWHEFILFTKQYELFCSKALGHFLHHTPAEAMRSPTQAQSGIKRAWLLACKREGISTLSPKMLPILFSLDFNLAIPDGFRYDLNCLLAKGTSNVYCATHIGCGSGCGSGCTGGGHNDGSHSDSGFGCSSSGCSGGCGGGD
ncbi:MAG: hypothetical protein CTY24_08165 [Methylobacter sp.]|nr:MAG: hypothetical protein CTY24_08165 [Methylobacter sp.]